MEKYFQPTPKMTQSTRSGRTPKRIYPDMEGESDDDYCPGPSSTKSPKPQKTKDTKASSTNTTTNKQKPKEAQVARIAKHYYTDNRATMFTGPWYREVTQRDEFWRDFNKHVPNAVIRRRFGITIDTDYTARTAMAIEACNKKASSSVGAKSTGLPSSSVTVEVPGAQTKITCQVCNKESDNETDICNTCLAQEDDGFNDGVIIKSEEKAETKLQARPFGTKAEPMKVEEDIKIEEGVEDTDRLPATSAPATDDEPELITLSNGKQAIRFGGSIQLITSTEKLVKAV